MCRQSKSASCLPSATGGGLTTKIAEDRQRSISCSTSRAELYDARDAETFREPCPHVRRVMAIAELLELRTGERDSLAEVLDWLAVAVILVDTKLRIVHTNIAADEVLANGGPLTATHGVLRTRDPRNRQTLRRASQAPDLGLRPIPLEARDRKLTVAAVLPLASSLRRGCAQPLTASAAVFVHHQPTFDMGLVTTLATTFRLTGAEARVLAGLLEGLHTSEIAQRNNISRNTVRTHLQRLFAKTNTKRQSDLVRVVSNALPPVRLDLSGAEHRGDDNIAAE